MMFRFNQYKGFSLIELMVVLAIVAVLLSLTGGLLQRNISQQERVVELEKVNQLLSQLSYKAYYGAGPYNIRFQENKITIVDSKNTAYNNQGKFNANSDTLELVFAHLTFVAQDVEISSKGVITPSYYSVIAKDNLQQFPFKMIFNEIPR